MKNDFESKNNSKKEKILELKSIGLKTYKASKNKKKKDKKKMYNKRKMFLKCVKIIWNQN